MEMSVINFYIMYKIVSKNRNQKTLIHLAYEKLLGDQYTFLSEKE